MNVIRLEHELPDEQVDALAGTFLDESSFDLLVESDTDVFKPNGAPLLKYRTNAISMQVCGAAFAALKAAAQGTDNRGLAAGPVMQEGSLASRRDGVAKSKHRFRVKKQDGTISATDRARTVNSGIVGYFDRYPRIPYCRKTAYNLAHPERFIAAMPFIRAVDDVFREHAPDRYAAQRAMIEKTHPDFTIHGTVFTTITVNKNYRTGVHKDAGDFAGGFGVMAALRLGTYTGGYLVFPKYRVAVNMKTAAVLLADVHEWHGNTELRGEKGKFDRLSCVFYYRENMFRCGSAAEELHRAKTRKPGDPMYD